MEPRHVDVLVVGAGISGISAAHHLQTQCPDRSFAILEGRSDLGGTWDLFRYPGIRSDSDMHTLGFSFRPWTGEKSIADGPSILAYLHDTVDELGIRDRIHFDRLVTTASWSSEQSTWTVTAERGDTGESETWTCNFLHMCSGYYSYEGGHEPDFPGADTFQGTIVHPQKWDESYDYSGQRVIIIGSGATAITLVPAMAEAAGHVTMVQRTPTWVVSMPERDPFERVLRKVVSEDRAYRWTPAKNMKQQEFLYRQTRVRPDRVRKILLWLTKKLVGDAVDVDRHFTPDYDPWDQRMCLIPDSDLWKAFKSGKASVVTDHIERFDETGIVLRSGDHLDADLVITATGLELVTSIGGVDFTVDGEQIDFGDTWTYKGLGFSDVPNMITTFGYVNASWTLRADMTSDYVCRLLNHMRKTGTTQCTPRLRPSDEGMQPRPFIDDFPAGYMLRAMPYLPKQGVTPWVNTQRLSEDRALIENAPVADGAMQFTTVESKVPATR